MFAVAIADLASIRTRAEIDLTESPAPQRLAPHARAMTAEVLRDDMELASGRLVVLYDPEGQDAWDGEWRIVAFARAELEPEMAADPMLSDVGWSWLEESLDNASVQYTAFGGTVTRTHSVAYAALSNRPHSGNLELRASWTPRDTAIRAHVEAWLELLATMAGLEPEIEGVTSLRR